MLSNSRNKNRWKIANNKSTRVSQPWFPPQGPARGLDGGRREKSTQLLRPGCSDVFSYTFTFCISHFRMNRNKITLSYKIIRQSVRDCKPLPKLMVKVACKFASDPFAILDPAYDPDPGLRSRSRIPIRIRIQDSDPDPGFRSGSRITIRIQDFDPDLPPNLINCSLTRDKKYCKSADYFLKGLAQV